MRYIALVSAVALALGGCAEPFQARVSRFQALPAPQGQTFRVEAGDPHLDNGLEFAHYADLVTTKLRAQGYQPAGPSEAATLIVSLDYGVDKGKVITESDPFFGCAGFGYGHFGYGGLGCGGFGYGYFGGYRGRYHRGYVIGYDPLFFGGYGQVESHIIYTSGLDLKIDRAADHQRLFEGHAKAISSDDKLTYLVPNLIDAMFTGFPGNSGETIKITVAPPKKS